MIDEKTNVIDETDESRKRTTWPIVHDVDGMWCSSQARDFSKRFGFDSSGAWEVEIVVRELVTNVLKYAKRGQLTLERVTEPEPALRITVEDEGGGIDDATSAFTDGYSKGRLLPPDIAHGERSGLGFGLGAVRRLTDSVVIEKTESGGTRIVAHKKIKPALSANRRGH